jgi:adenosylhomocysteine nucleosidase
MYLIAVICANWFEFGESKSYLQISDQGTRNELQFFKGNFGGKSILFARTGVGIRRARNGTNFVIQKFKPELIISAGLGGALRDGLRVGDIIVGKWVSSLKRNEKKRLFCDINRLSMDFIMGGLLTEDRFLHDPDEKRRLFRQTGALSVDMETWGVVEAADEYGTPVISVRSISDDNQVDLPDMRHFYSRCGELRKLNAFRYLIVKPTLIYPFLRLVLFDMRKSTSTLNRFLKELIQNL